MIAAGNYINSEENREIELEQVPEGGPPANRDEFLDENNPSFIYRDYNRIRNGQLKYMMCIIACQLSIVMLMTVLNLYVYSMEVKTKYSMNERKWICETLSEVAIMYTGVVVFQIFTLGISPTATEFRFKQILLIIFTMVLYCRIVYLYYEGLEINKEASE